MQTNHLFIFTLLFTAMMLVGCVEIKELEPTIIKQVEEAAIEDIKELEKKQEGKAHPYSHER